MQTLLISIDSFDAFTQPAAELIDITDTLLASGWRVEVICSTAGKTLGAEIARLTATGRFAIITDKQGELARHYTLIWIYRGFFSDKLLDALSAGDLRGAMLFRHYCDYNDMYIPWGVALENRLAALTLDLSPRSSAILLQTGIEPAQLKTMPWSVPRHLAQNVRTREPQSQSPAVYIAL